MSSHRMEIRVRPRSGRLAPAGEIGKAIYVDLDAPSPEAAMDATEAMCRRILANPVMEDFDVFLAGEEVEATP